MTRRVPISSWLIRLITWDGVLPATIWLVPFFVRSLIPGNRAAIEVTAVVLPVVAFFVRYQVGKRCIASNDCGALVRRFQLTMFCLGIFVLVLVDAVMVLAHVMPKGALFVTTADFVVGAAFYAFYVTTMALAMYPGFGGRSALLDPLGVESRSNNPRNLSKDGIRDSG